MNYKRVMILFLVFTLTIANISFAQSQAIRPTRGGILKKAGKYFIEIVKGDQRILFYIINPIDEAFSVPSTHGYAEIKYEDMAVKENLKSVDSITFMVPLKKEYLLKGKLHVTIKDKEYIVRFKRNEIIHRSKQERQYKIPKNNTPSRDNHGGHTH